MELLFQGARECERNYKLARGFTGKSYSSSTPQKHNFKKSNTYHSKNYHSNSFGKPHPVSNMATHQTNHNSDAMDLDIIDLSNTECYKCHKKGLISRNCRSGKKNFTPHQKKGPNLMVIDLIPLQAELHNQGERRTSSMECKQDINGNVDPDPREELENYKKIYLEALEDMDPTTIIDLQKEARVFAKNSEQQCCESCYRFGCYDSPKSNYDFIVRKHSLAEDLEDPPPDDPQDTELFYAELKTNHKRSPLWKRRKID